MTIEVGRLFALQNSGNAFEAIVTGLYRAVLRAGDLAVDGGANRGLHTVPMAEAVGPTGRLLAFEPIPSLADKLREVCAGRGAMQVEVRQAALSDRAGTASFHWIRNADGYSGLQPRPYPFTPNVEKLAVATVLLDQQLAGETLPLRFVKLDLEGGEFRALQGAALALEGAHPVIVFENSRAPAATAYGYSADEFFAFFDRLGYRLLDLFGRPFGQQHWDTRGVPWYFIAVAAGSADEMLVATQLPGILAKVLAKTG